MFIGVKALRVDASVADDIVEGFGDVSAPAAQVSILPAAVNQVLWTQGDEDACVSLHLALKGLRCTEGPA